MKQRLRKKLRVGEFARAKEVDPPPQYCDRGEELQKLLEAAFPDPDARRHWLQSHSGQLRGRTPIFTAPN